eukprot:gene7065-14370_t
MSISLSGSSKNISTHGKLLISELSVPNASIENVMAYIAKDRFAALLKNENGCNSFHILMDSGYSKDFILPVLQSLLERSPNGAKIKDRSDFLPLHYALSHKNIIEDAINMLLDIYPDGANARNGDGFIPLFLCVMRDSPSLSLCSRLCELYPEGPSIQNNSKSLPLHFAVNRLKPNKDLLRLLLSKYPDAARMKNAHGLLPFHCICSMSDDIEAVDIIYKAYPNAIREKDGLGKIPLHLAVLAVGKDHAQAVQEEEEEMLNRKKWDNEEKCDKLSANKNKNSTNDHILDNVEVEDEYSDDDAEYGLSDVFERSGKGRGVIRYLISHFPEGLITKNNFFCVPVETVLEKTRPVNTKSRQVLLFGLYDDPPTARLLLYSHANYYKKKVLPQMTRRFNDCLRDMNWIARRDAVFISLVGEPREKYTLAAAAAAGTGTGSSTTKTVTTSNKNKHMNTKKMKSSTKKEKEITIPSNNILARLRRHGVLECVIHCISFI